jgi:putative transposase
VWLVHRYQRTPRQKAERHHISRGDAVTRWHPTRHHQHEHGETKQTPLARYTAGLEHVRPADPEAVRLAFLWREKRQVRRDATLSLQGNTYQVDPAWAGQTIELRLDPFDLSHIELYLNNQHLGSATVITQKRQRHLKVERLATEPPDPPKPKSSLDFLAALREEYRTQQQRELGQLHFSHLRSDWPLPPDTRSPDADASAQLVPSEV